MAKKENNHRPDGGFPWGFILLAMLLLGGVLFINRAWVGQQWNSLTEITQQVPESESQPAESEKIETVEEVSQEESMVVEETIEVPEPTLEELYAELEDPQTYSIYQYNANGSIEDLHVRRAFKVLTDYLKEDDNFYSTVEYMIKVYPTLDENVSILELSERYADREVERGHYRFDYRAHEVKKYQ